MGCIENWSKFREGEIVIVKSIGENRMVLIAVGADKLARQELIASLESKLAELKNQT